MDNIEIEGIFTHFWGEEYDDCKEQFDIFQKLLEMLSENGVNPEIKHCCNSNAAFRFPEFHLDMCRIGNGLYGYYDSHITPVMEFKTIIVSIKDVGIGEGVGYDHTFIADRPIKIAVLPVGYADGYYSLFSGKSSVCIGGEIVPIVGKVCMDMIMIDITGIKAIPKIGDEVTLYGRTGVTMGMIEGWSGIHSREILCAVGRRVPRVFV
jgi:alanine racemase